MSSMVFCRGCGASIHESAPQCPKCGFVQQGVAQQAPEVKVAVTPTAAPSQTTTVSKAWQEIFALIDKAGGAELPQLDALTTAEKHRVQRNALAFVFSWMYYFVQGLWKKGLSLLALTIVLSIVIEVVLAIVGGYGLARMSAFVTWGMVGMFASMGSRVDYYKKVRQGWNGWW